MGAVFKLGKIASTAENQVRTRAGKLMYASLHSEMNALFKSLKTVNKTNRFCDTKRLKRPRAVIWIVRVVKTGGVANCMPCLHCQKWLAFYNVQRIKYTDVINDIPVLRELKIK